MTHREPSQRPPEAAAASATRPFAAARTGPMAARGELGSVLKAAHALLARLGARIEILARACRDAGVPMPGAEPPPDVPLEEPQAVRVHTYLVGLMRTDAARGRAAAVAVFRLTETRAAVAAAEAALNGRDDLAPALAMLKQKLYLLAHAPRALAGDPILDTLFPPAASAPATLAAADAQATGRLRRHEQTARVEAFLERLAPRMAQAERVAAQVGRSASFRELMDPTRRREAYQAAQLTVDGKARGELEGVIKDYANLRRLLAVALETGDATPLEAAVAAFSRRLRVAAVRSPLKDLLGGI